MKSKQEVWQRRIPSMERILSSDEAASVITRHGREAVKGSASEVLDAIRSSGGAGDVTVGDVLGKAARLLDDRSIPSLRRVINASGVLIHTNLGRSPVSPGLWAGAAEIVGGYSNLEFDLAAGSRGKRDHHIAKNAARLFGSESALLVNNNAAAVLLLLSAVATGSEVLVSRGELVEIGGGFRVPDIIQQGGARLVEVGTTNRTRAPDYEKAITDRTAAVLLVHRSNFDIVGFTESPTVAELVEICRRHDVPLLCDEGTGRAVDLSKYGVAPAPTVGEMLASGIDVVTCSTDKLLGTVQGGLILGRRDLLDKCARHPLMRALRGGKESYALIAATLSSFAAGFHERDIPLYAMLSRSTEELRARAGRVAAAVSGEAVDTRAAIGGGTTPNETIASCGVRLTGNAERWRELLLEAAVPVVGTIVDDRFTLDLRSVDPSDGEMLIATLKDVAARL
jgi:L-seryl-tRNA(Ser) seleniumtransferase